MLLAICYRDTVAACALGVVERLIGPYQPLCRSRGRCIENGESNTDGEFDHPIIMVNNMLSNCLPQTFGDQPGSLTVCVQ